MANLPVQGTPVLNEDGTMSDAWYRALYNLVNGEGAGTIKSIVSGVAEAQAKADGIANGSVSIDPTISNRGKLSTELDATASNVTNVSVAASSGGALTASADKYYVYGPASGGGAGTTGTVTVTPSGGTAPYAYAWTKKSGDTLTVNSPSAAATDFTSTPGENQTDSAIYICTVTDSAGSPATYVVEVSVSIIDVT